MGFEPITINNHLLRLGYSINDDKIYDFQKDDFVFKLNKLNQAPSRLDHKKLININSNFIKNAKIEYILKEIVSRYQIKERKTLENLSKLLPDLLKRYNFINEIENDLIWIDQKNFKIKDEAITKKLKDNNVTIENIYDLLKSCDWELNAIKTSIEKYINDNNKKISEIAPLIRLCLTGKTNTPDIFNVIFVLGKEACLKRLKTHG